MNGTIQYTIRPYDTIWMLAQIFNTTVDSIMDLNPGIDPRNLFIGQVINIRPGYQYYPSSQGTPGSMGGGRTSTGTPSMGVPPATGTPSMGVPPTTGTPSMGAPGTTGTPSMGMPGTTGTPSTGRPGTTGTPSMGMPGTTGTPGTGRPGTTGTPNTGGSGSKGNTGMSGTQNYMGYSDMSEIPYYFANDESMDDVGEMEQLDQDLQDLDNYFRMLWEQHVTWTRIAVMGLIHDLPETEQIIQRLLRNPVDFANALMPFYGEEVADEFEKLLTGHLTIASEIVKAAKAGDNNKVAEANKRWHDNADQIAKLLGSVNPHWSEDDWSAMLNEHLELLFNDVAQMLAGKYEESINGFDEIEMQALEMADMMADGIAMQFSNY